MVVFPNERVFVPEEAAATSIVPVNAEPEGTVNFNAACVASPTTTFELVPETVQAPPKVKTVVFRI